MGFVFASRFVEICLVLVHLVDRMNQTAEWRKKSPRNRWNSRKFTHRMDSMRELCVCVYCEREILKVAHTCWCAKHKIQTDASSRLFNVLYSIWLRAAPSSTRSQFIVRFISGRMFPLESITFQSTFAHECRLWVVTSCVNGSEGNRWSAIGQIQMGKICNRQHTKATREVTHTHVETLSTFHWNLYFGFASVCVVCRT